VKARTPRPSQRPALLSQLRRSKMAESVHAYMRGNTLKFYEWLDSARAAKSIPQGPPVWICGDCHIGNLGPVASAEGQIDIQIRDFDQTVIGNPAHDLIRLSLSLATAARSSDLPGVTTALMIEKVMEGYRKGLLTSKTDTTDRKVEPIRVVMKQALHRKWRNLAQERIDDVTPHIPLGKRFWPLSKVERQELDRIFAEEETRELITCLKSRKNSAPVTMLDAAYWVKGCSSLGRLRYAVLAGIGKNARAEMCLVDIKESTKAIAPRSTDAAMPANNAKRVVAGAKALSPLLGDRMLAAQFSGQPVVLRELMPQDLKFEMEQLDQDEAVAAAKLFASIVGEAHGRQMDRKTRVAWAKELGRKQPKKLNAPSWLWSSVVELAADHEAAYLDHCRAFALDSKPT
jgi:uncharacterized protein (DUF2252 family)